MFISWLIQGFHEMTWPAIRNSDLSTITKQTHSNENINARESVSVGKFNLNKWQLISLCIRQLLCMKGGPCMTIKEMAQGYWHDVHSMLGMIGVANPERCDADPNSSR